VRAQVVAHSFNHQEGEFDMLLAYSMGDFLGYTVLFLAVLIMCAKKLAKDNPEVNDAAKKAAAAKALQMIGRFFK
jgi:hypothetical protein